MNKKRAIKTKVIIESIVSFLLLLCLLLINELTEIKFDIEWFKNPDIWINDFFVNTFVFLLMSTLLSKINNSYINFGISYIVSITIGNFVQFDTFNFKFTFKSVAIILIHIIALIVWWFTGYYFGNREIKKEMVEAQANYEEQLINMDDDVRAELYNLKRFIKKHPKQCRAIDIFGIDFVMKFVEDDKTIRRSKK